MSVNFDAYVVLDVLAKILTIPFFILASFKRNETYSRIIQLICTSALLIINLIQIPMQIHMEESYTQNIILVILWFISSLCTAFSLGEDS